MQGQLSQKERMLLEDLKKEEDLCVIKYQNYAGQAQDSQLSQLFQKLAGEEQKHYDTVNQLLQSGGTAKSGSSGGSSNAGQSMQGGSQSGQSMASGGLSKAGQQSKMQLGQMSPMADAAKGSAQSSGSGGSGSSGGSDQYLLQDMLSTEKYVSSAYDTSVFESSQSNVRKALQQIQQDEQDHGEQLYQYMSSHGMY